jgi:hypothetical protein
MKKTEFHGFFYIACVSLDVDYDDVVDDVAGAGVVHCVARFVASSSLWMCDVSYCLPR